MKIYVKIRDHVMVPTTYITWSSCVHKDRDSTSSFTEHRMCSEKTDVVNLWKKASLPNTNPHRKQHVFQRPTDIETFNGVDSNIGVCLVCVGACIVAMYRCCAKIMRLRTHRSDLYTLPLWSERATCGSHWCSWVYRVSTSHRFFESETYEDLH